MMKVVKDGLRAEVTPEGDIVASMADDFRGHLKTLAKEGVTEMVIDMSNVEVIDSIGLGLIISTHNTMNKAKGALRVTNVSRDVLGLFKTMRLDQHFSVAGSVDSGAAK
jgi:anti-anti-sigma factor